MEKVTIKEVLQESAMISMSLDNLGMCYNEGVAGNVISAINRMLAKFIAWIKSTVLPMLKKIGLFIENLLRKTKLGRKALAGVDRRRAEKEKQEVEEQEANEKKEQQEAEDEDDGLSKIKRKVLVSPRWVNYVAHSILVPNRMMKLANNTVDNTDKINEISNEVDKHIEDGKKTKIIVGYENFHSIAVEQLEVMQKSVKALQRFAYETCTRCEDLRKTLEGKNDQGSAMRAKNINNVVNMIINKTTVTLNQATENIKMLEKAVDLTKR